jgi:hypothetical protein
LPEIAVRHMYRAANSTSVCFGSVIHVGIDRGRFGFVRGRRANAYTE